MRSLLCVAAALSVAGAPLWGTGLSAQRPDSTTAGPVLSLDEAIGLAVKNNPDHLQTVSTLGVASAARRAAIGQFLPSAFLDGAGTYQQAGAQPLGGITFGAPSDVYQSSWFLGVGYKLAFSTFVGPKLQSANVRAAEADITGSRENVRANVAQQYFNVLQDDAKSALADTLVVNAAAQLELAKAKRAVGSGTQLDVSRAEVNLGQQQVNALQARNQVQIDKLRLFQVMGIPQPANVQLNSKFEVKEPEFTLDSVLRIARVDNPGLLALRSREDVAALSVKSVRSDYLPSLNVTTGWGGYTYSIADDSAFIRGQASAVQASSFQCFANDSVRIRTGLAPIGGCPANQLTPSQYNALLRGNNQFPFNFNRQPFLLTATLHLPIFDGLDRERRVQEAEANQSNARYKVKAQQLALTANVSGAYYTLVTSARTERLQEQNAAKAADELRLAEERYRVGAATFLDLNDARASFERAENDRINAIYDFHKAFAALESAVGRPLR